MVLDRSPDFLYCSVAQYVQNTGYAPRLTRNSHKNLRYEEILIIFLLQQRNIMQPRNAICNMP